MKSKSVFFFLIFSLLLNAQTPIIKWSQKFDNKDFNFIGYKNNNFYFEKYQSNLMQGDRVTYRIVNKELNSSIDKFFSFKSDTINYSYFKTLFFQDKIGQVIRNKDKKIKAEVLKINFNDNELNTKNDLRKVFEMSNKIGPIGLGLYQYFSPDHSKLLIYSTSFEQRGLKQDLHYKVFHAETMKLQYEGIFETPLKGKNFERKKVVVDNDGNIIQLNEITKTPKELKLGLKPEYVINIISPQNVITEIEIDQSFGTHNLDIYQTENSKIFLVGFDFNNAGEINYFIRKIDASSSKLEPKISFAVNTIFPANNSNAKKEEFTPFETNKIYEKKEGGYSIILQQIKMTLVYSNYTYSYRTFFGNIVNIQTDAQNNVLKYNVLPARNNILACTFKNDITYLAYQDNKAVINANTIEEYIKMQPTFNVTNKDDALFLYSFQNNGELKKEMIYDYQNNDFAPTQGISTIEPGVFLLNTVNQIGVLKI